MQFDTNGGGFWGAVMLVVNVVLGGIIGAWALRRRVRDEANIGSEVRAQTELSHVRAEYLERIQRLEKRLDTKDNEIKRLSDELANARVTIAGQAARISSLEEALASLHRERLT